MEYSRFATSSRLLSCLVNEGLIKYEVLNDHIVFNSKVTCRYEPYTTCFMDPHDLKFPIFKVGDEPSEKCLGPSEIWDLLGLEDVKSIKLELENSVLNQHQSLRCRSLNLPSSDIEWEQSIIEGHATHPMHRTRLGFTLEESAKYSSEYRTIVNVGCALIKKSEFWIFGDFSNIVEELVSEKFEYDRSVYSLMLFHPGNQETLERMFPDKFQILDFTLPCYATASLRTLVPVNNSKYTVKLSLNVRATSALRTISKYSIYNGVRLTEFMNNLNEECLALVTESQSVYLNEIASCGVKEDDPEIAKYFGCIIREDSREKNGQDYEYIICASLVERDVDRVPLVVKKFNLDTLEKRMEFFREYTRVFLNTILPPLFLKNFAFEAHGQNSLLIVKDGQLKGFCMRDYGGLSIYKPDLSLMRESGICTDNIKDVMIRSFHTAVQCHLYRLLRVLEVPVPELRNQVDEWIVSHITPQVFVRYPNVSFAYEAFSSVWLKSPVVSFKSFLKMKINQLYRDYIYSDIGNILYSDNYSK